MALKMAKEETNLTNCIITETLKFMFLIFLPICLLIGIYRCTLTESMSSHIHRSTVDKSSIEKIDNAYNFMSKLMAPIFTEDPTSSNILPSSLDQEIVPKTAILTDSTLFAKLLSPTVSNTAFSKSNAAALMNVKSESRSDIDLNQIDGTHSNKNDYEAGESYAWKSAGPARILRIRRRSLDGLNVDSQLHDRVKRSDTTILKVGAYDHNILDNIEDTKHYHFYDPRLNPGGEVPDSKEEP